MDLEALPLASLIQTTGVPIAAVAMNLLAHVGKNIRSRARCALSVMFAKAQAHQKR